MVHPTRRSLLATAVAAGAFGFAASAFGPAAPVSAAPVRPPRRPEPGAPVSIRWIDGAPPSELPGGTTWGVPWPRGTVADGQEFALTDAAGGAVPVQSWVTGWWPDGSIKWTAHAVGDAARAEAFQLAPGAPAAPAAAVAVTRSGGAVTVNTGVITVTFPTKGPKVIGAITRDRVTIARDGVLVASRQDQPSGDGPVKPQTQSFTSDISAVTIEQEGPVRAVVKVEGMHRKGNRSWLPFTLRFYLYAGSDAIRLMHTFIFDGDHHTDFINGVGVQLQVPMRDDLHDRHIRFAGADGGVFAEAVRPITGLRRDPGAAVRQAQVDGIYTPPTTEWDQRVTTRLHWIPGFGDYRLTQLNARGFDIHKRTQAGQSWLHPDSGSRAAGLAFCGSPSGGLAFGMRNFWQLHPTELEIAGAATETATATVWMWSPRAGSMDLRPYHDGMGQDTYPEQLDALEITYEDYEPGFDTPVGIARTSELYFWALPATPTRERFAALAQATMAPPMLASTPEYNASAGVFGNWAPVDRSVPAKAQIEDNLDLMHTYAREQVEQRSWYGFWDFGDVMHSYDGDRHTWRYDIGGYAWDNSELSTDLWLWYHYLRTGDPVAFRFAEAMTRHTGEVDTYHLGEFRGLGTRHGVTHWADSAKQNRISNAGYRRIFYFLTADERAGDLLHELIDADRTFLTLDPVRKIRTDTFEPTEDALPVGKTTDWGALALAWLTEWERGGDPIAKTKLINGAQSLAALPNGWAQGGLITYELATGIFTGPAEQLVEVGSLNAVFGLFELMAELIDLIDDPEVERQWVNYCKLYNGTGEDQIAITGAAWGNQNLRQAYSRGTAYAASRLGDDELARRAWTEFRTGHAGYPADHPFGSVRIEPPLVLNAVDEADLSTNANAQYGLAAFQCLALVGDVIEEA